MYNIDDYQITTCKMSFKREGNDGSWLRSLQKRRVSELLTEDIPEGEAHLMRNGKFACMICSHRPVFETVKMLSVHRNGKKHLLSVSCKEAEKEELDLLRRTRLHEEYVNTGKISPQLLRELDMQPKPSGVQLLGAKPYDPRVKKRPDRRRHILDLSAAESPNISAVAADILSSQKQVQDKSNPPQTISEYKKRKHFDHQDNRTHLKPYQRRSLSNGVSDAGAPSQPHSVERSVPSGHPVSPVVCDNRECSSTDAPGNNIPIVKKPKQKTKVLESATNCDSAAAESKAKMNERYLEALASGWKKDRGGCWVKDADVEFDSDEEPPDLP